MNGYQTNLVFVPNFFVFLSGLVRYILCFQQTDGLNQNISTCYKSGDNPNIPLLFDVEYKNGGV